VTPRPDQPSELEAVDASRYARRIEAPDNGPASDLS
jgi:hypothetical protein